MSNITVSYSEIETAATQLGAGREEIIPTKLQGMQTQIQSLLFSGFVTEQASRKVQRRVHEHHRREAAGPQLNDIQ